MITLVVVYTVSQKKEHFCFLELCQIFTNINTVWYEDGKMTAIVCYIYIFHLTYPMPPLYLVNHVCFKLLHNTGVGRHLKARLQ